MFIPSIDAMWCECLTFFYKIGFSSFSTRSIVRWLKFERNEFHVFNRVIRQVEMCRYCCCSVSVTRVVCGLSVFGESPGRYSPKFRIGVCRERSQTLTLSKDKENEN